MPHPGWYEMSNEQRSLATVNKRAKKEGPTAWVMPEYDEGK
jgi:hypothetical protein